MHGANASGRPFTGDYAGILLYDTLHRYGFATRAGGDSARRRTAADRLPDHQRREVPAARQQADAGGGARRATTYLAADLRTVPEGGAILALGRIAHDADVARARATAPPTFPFAHGAAHPLPASRLLVDSYHCSRYNTNTRRLTAGDVPRRVRHASRAHLGKSGMAEQGFAAVARSRRRRPASAARRRFDARELLDVAAASAGRLPDARTPPARRSTSARRAT